MNPVVALALKSGQQVLASLAHNWPFLAVSVVIAAVLKLYTNPASISAFLNRRRTAGVIGATVAAVATPLCSCGTTALALGMMANLMPWAPVVAFIAASPLTSPEELVYSAGLFGWPFAWTFFGASIFVGLAAGAVTAVLERRGWLAQQTRIRLETAAVPATAPASGCGCACDCPAPTPPPPSRLRLLTAELLGTGRRLVLMFVAFAFVGNFLNGLIPAAWMATLFGEGATYGVPLAATLGFPVYISTEASLPLVRSMIDAGMSQGAALAFLITGAGTSLGAIAGLLTIARWRIVAVVVGTLWVSAVLFGTVYNVL
jgi:uncharacterized membrane protein YraQ (UPF0718 family)